MPCLVKTLRPIVAQIRELISQISGAVRAHDVYQLARARGADHPHAIRILGRAWARILWRCWQDHTPYDPTNQGNLNLLLAVVCV